MNNYSRYERTQKSKKQNIILNVLIGVVFVGILAVGATFLFGDDEPASKEQANQQNESASTEETNDTNNEETNETTNEEGNESSTDEQDKKASEEEDSESVEMKEEDSEEDASAEEDNSGYKTHKDESAGEDGEWEPIGTKQEGEHQNSFEMDSLDWKEKEKALQYATGLSPDEIVYWWIGNGGSPNTAKGIVSKASNKDNPYVVMLEWVDGEGWKPVSVEREPGAADGH
ncbi:DUF1510 family protein [Pseudalkalibacillus sp. SCS-8]|uniref:DUF1510 family protein n=1 Tax=Pseudalkalibacillus nanhaiensis TaxID=3115291 RepID=UPI0032D9CDBE